MRVDNDMFSYKKHIRRKVINRLKIIFVVIFMGFLFLNVSQVHADEMQDKNKPIWMTIDGHRVQIPVGVAKQLVMQQEGTQEPVTTKHASVETDLDNNWILEAPGF